MGTPQDGYSAYGSFSISSTAGADVNAKGCEFVHYEMTSVADTPAIKAYGAGPSGTFKPIRYRLHTAAGAESLIDADTGSGTLLINDRIIVPNLGYDQIRIITTTGTATCSATIQHDGGVMYELQKLQDAGLAVTITQPDAIIGPGDPVVDSYTSIAINLTTGANQVLVSSAADKQIWVYGHAFTAGDAAGQTVSFQDEDDTAKSGIIEVTQYGGMARNPSGNFAMPLWKLATNKDLEVDITGGDVDGDLEYAIVSV